MFDKCLVTRKEVENVCLMNGYQIGYMAINKDITFKNLTVYYFRDSFVFAAEYQNGFVDSFQQCTSDSESNGYRIYDLSKEQVLRQIDTMLTHPASVPASLLGAFNNVIFRDYEDSSAKFTLLKAALPDFHPDFKKIFDSEIQALCPPELPSEKINQYDLFLDSNGTLYYVSAIADPVYVLQPNPLSEEMSFSSKTVEFRELLNTSKFRRAPLSALGTSKAVFLDFCVLCRSFINSVENPALNLPTVPVDINIQKDLVNIGTSKSSLNETEFIFSAHDGLMIKISFMIGDVFVNTFMGGGSIGIEEMSAAYFIAKFENELTQSDIKVSALLEAGFKTFLPVLYHFGWLNWYVELYNAWFAHEHKDSSPVADALGTSSKEVTAIGAFGNMEDDSFSIPDLAE